MFKITNPRESVSIVNIMLARIVFVLLWVHLLRTLLPVATIGNHNLTEYIVREPESFS